MSLPSPGPALAEAFDAAAGHYDRLVALSPGYHRQLADSARTLVGRLPTEATVVLDLGCGTGASTAALVEALRCAGRAAVRVEGVDASPGMVSLAQAKSWPDTVSFHCADALADLATRMEGSVGGILAAYLVRNVPQVDALLTAAARALAAHGVLVVHDYSVAGNRSATLVWDAVCRGVVIPAAYLADRDVRLYRYLRESVRNFDSVPRLTERLQQAGFTGLEPATVSGWQRGIVHRISGVRS